VKTVEPLHKPLRFLVLIPQGNTDSLKDRKRSLFAAGFPGAWSFPALVPVALSARPFSRPELKSLAVSLRHASMADGRGGKIRLREPQILDCPGIPGIFGPALDLPAPVLPPEGLLLPFPVLVLAAALADPADKDLLPRAWAMLSPGAPFSFSAAAVANMILEPLSGSPAGTGSRNTPHKPGKDGVYSFIWKIGCPQWLPSPKDRHLRAPFESPPRATPAGVKGEW
jgi:hypothetical protein